MGWGHWASCYNVCVVCYVKMSRRSSSPQLNCGIREFYFRHPFSLFLHRTSAFQVHRILVLHLLPVITQPSPSHQNHSQESSCLNFVWNPVNSITFLRCVCNWGFFVCLFIFNSLNIYIYIFIYLAALGLSCSTWGLHCDMQNLFSCSMWDLQLRHVNS